MCLADVSISVFEKVLSADGNQMVGIVATTQSKAQILPFLTALDSHISPYHSCSEHFIQTTQ
jgi:hypothetical protein